MTAVERFEQVFFYALTHRKWTPVLFEHFQQSVMSYYYDHKRDFEWRTHISPYRVLVSEIMLQQTQTSRVIEKFASFIKRFPTMHDLASVSTQEVLQEWIGLGYNRRGLALHEIARKVITEHCGVLPDTVEVLKTFKGLGHATASSIVAFAFNKPTVFIETNIRAVFLHVFFRDEEKVPDAFLEPLVALTVKEDNPREWYYALMDYGVYLKKKHKNPSRKSKHYTKQSKFEGSTRQVRAAIVKVLAFSGAVTLEKLYQLLTYDQQKIDQQLEKLCSEKIIILEENNYRLQ